VIADNNFDAVAHGVSQPAVVTAGDYLNKLSGEKIERECKDKIDAGATELVVDFSQTEVINSIGISILLGVIDNARNAGAKIIFSDLNEESAELFETLGLMRHVSVA